MPKLKICNLKREKILSLGLFELVTSLQGSTPSDAAKVSSAKDEVNRLLISMCESDNNYQIRQVALALLTCALDIMA